MAVPHAYGLWTIGHSRRHVEELKARLNAKDSTRSTMLFTGYYTLLNFVSLAKRIAENGIHSPSRSCTISNSPSWL
jgi:hypothetical protein